MKITLAVLFLAGLTIYCKFTAVLSLPPSLIASAASLERTQTQARTADNGDGGGGLVAGVAGSAEDAGTLANDGDDDDDGSDIAGETAAFYKNAKNLWHKDFRLQKRERNAFDDDIAAVVAAPQQSLHQQQVLHHQANAAIKNNKNVLQQVATARQKEQQQHQYQQQPYDNGNNNFLKMKSSATKAKYPNAEQHQLAGDEDDGVGDEDAAAEFDSNEWLAPSPKMTDDISVLPPLPSTPLLATIEDEESDGSIGNRGYDEGDNDFESLEITTQPHNLPPYGGVSSSTPLEDETADGSLTWSEFQRPLKHWAKQCQMENENNCPQDYYRALIAGRNNAFLKQIRYKQNMAPLIDPLTHSLGVPPLPTADIPLDLMDSSESLSPMAKTINNLNNDDVLLLLTAEQNLVQFLTWALAELYPMGKFSNGSENGADSYHPGMFMWKKFNLSGRLEPPMFVQEPQYVIVRREYDSDDDYKRGIRFRDDPFIPPRGRKHHLPDLDSLLQRYETFVPNRGRRDKIKDIFKYDDLFYPNRGKRQMSLESGDSDFKENHQYHHQQAQLRNEANANELMAAQLQQPLTKTLEHINNLMAKMKRKLHHQMQLQRSLANSFDEMSSNEPTTATRMSTTYQASQSPQRLSKRLKSMANILQQQRRQHLPSSNKNSNSRRQWWKRYSTTADNRPAASAMATARARTAAATNRLHALRSMSPLQQQLQDSLERAKEYLSPIRLHQANKFMWQPSQALQQHQATPSAVAAAAAAATTLQQSLAQQFDPLSWHKLQMLQHQYHLPLLTTMRQPRLTAATAGRQHQQPSVVRQQQLATPQETQLSYSSAATADNSVANDLKTLFNTDYD